jgi:RimJ/RimL family protein N-acetyltransferase
MTSTTPPANASARARAEVRLRLAAIDDAPAIAGYLGALFADPDLDTLARRPAPTVEDEEEFLRKALENDRAVIVLAFAGERLIGMADIIAWDRPEGRHCGRLGMSVAKAWRGRGVGRRLLTAAIERTKHWLGFSRIELEVVPWNTAGIALYESLGFQHEGRRVGAMNLRGRPEDVLMMGMVW